MEAPTDIDITGYTFDEFVSFVFDHDVVPDHEKQWYWKIPDVTSGHRRFVHITCDCFGNLNSFLSDFLSLSLTRASGQYSGDLTGQFKICFGNLESPSQSEKNA
jgi:hypothetical protein